MANQTVQHRPNESHGHAKAGAYSPTYRSWAGIKQRCFNPDVKAYADYGGRGITMCDEWRNSFRTFLDDMGECPDGMSIDRIDNDGNYEPTNCRWATKSEQNSNQRRNKGKHMKIKETIRKEKAKLIRERKEIDRQIKALDVAEKALSPAKKKTVPLTRKPKAVEAE